MHLGITVVYTSAGQNIEKREEEEEGEEGLFGIQGFYFF